MTTQAPRALPLRFSANLSMLFGEVPFLERFDAAARAGFRAVEFMFPYEYAVDALRAALERNALDLVLINLPAGDFAAGERGIAVDPARGDDFRRGVELAVSYARALHVPRVNCLVGRHCPGVSDATEREALIANLHFAADALAVHGIRLLVEPLNSRDVAGFVLDTPSKVLAALDEAGHPNAFLQYDVYHAQRMEGELAATLRAQLPRIGHVQVADNPGRHQPGTGEINFRWLLADLADAGYDGHVGLEYAPQPDTLRSLAWIHEHGFAL